MLKLIESKDRISYDFKKFWSTFMYLMFSIENFGLSDQDVTGTTCSGNRTVFFLVTFDTIEFLQGRG